jgi:magnesium-transporting ATPase (P-type)
MEKKTKSFKTKASVFKALGYAATGLGTLGGFFVYQMTTNWQQFQTQLENFVVVNQESVKLNMVLAIPILLSIIIFVSITMRKNREFFKDKVSLSLLLTIAIFYLIYSIIEITLATLTGAFLGSIVDEFVFTPIASFNQEKFLESKDVDIEYVKEMRRITARKKVKEDLDGSV